MLSAAAEPELVVAELFGPTIQGEGPSAGRIAVFVRLSRCNLACRGCDTPYTWDRSRFDLRAESHRATAAEVGAWAVGTGVELVVITGGEPLLQQRPLTTLLETLVGHGRRVEIETNGTITPAPRVVELVDRFTVSPKPARFGAGMDPTRRIRAEALRVFSRSGKAVFKFVVSEVADLDEVAALAGAHDLREVWVMPEGTDADTVTRRLRLLAEPAIARGFHLTPRLHVLLWGDERGR